MPDTNQNNKGGNKGGGNKGKSNGDNKSREHMSEIGRKGGEASRSGGNKGNNRK